MIRYVIDLTTIVAVAVVLAAAYCALKIEPLTGLHLLFPSLGEFTFRYWTIGYFPWPDTADNIYLGFALAHGSPIIEAGADNHMPGVPQLLGGWLWLLGYANAIPSPRITASAYLAACLAGLLFETTCIYVAARMMLLPPLAAALVALMACAYTALLYDFALPMSETLITYLLIFFPLLASRMLLAEQPAERLVAAVVLGGPLTFACLLLGLTIGPANALVAVTALIVAGLELWNTPTQWRILLHDRRCRVAYAVVAALVAVTFATVRTGDLYFWAVESNLSRDVSPIGTIAASFTVHFASFLNGEDPIGSRYPALLSALVVYFCVKLIGAHKPASLPRLALFGVLIVAMAILTQWRANERFHSVTPLGLTIGVILLAAGALPQRWNVARSSVWLLPLWLLALGQVMFLRMAIAGPAKPEPRPAAFETANVCRAWTTINCRCAQVSVYGPQMFLLNDMRPCPNRPLTFNAPGAMNPKIRRWIEQDATDPNVASWVYDSDALMIANGVPPAVVQYWRTEARCVDIDDRNKWCFAK